MIVQKSRLLLEPGGARLVATVCSESLRFAPFDVSIGVPSAYVGWLDPTSNPFVPLLLLLAGVLRERLCLEGTVSPQILANAGKASALFQEWWGTEPVVVEAEPRAHQRPPGAGSALFFTRGVDSWFSALRAERGEFPDPLTNLLYVPDLDRHYSAGTRKRALQKTREAAAELQLPLIAISTNVRELLDRFVNWDCSHGSVLAGIGLALGYGLRSVSLASTIDRTRSVPCGSHPELDPLWSTERTAIRHDGVETPRTAKVLSIAGSDRALRHLKVCWREDIDANCGRCEKCLRTQCALAIAGALDRTAVFRERLTPQAVSELSPLSDSEMATAHAASWVELCENFPDRPDLAELRAAAFRRLPAQHHRSIKVSTARSTALGVPSSTSGDRADRSASGGADLSWRPPAPGRIRLSLRPPSGMVPKILDACRDQAERPNPWCMMGQATPEMARLLLRLTESWGQGLACLNPSAPALGESQMNPTSLERIQRGSRMRVWWGGDDYLNAFLVLDALSHGCLPLQCVNAKDHEALAGQLPPGLAGFFLAIPDAGPVPRVADEERNARLDAGLSVVLSGSLERELAHAMLLSHRS